MSDQEAADQGTDLMGNGGKVTVEAVTHKATGNLAIALTLKDLEGKEVNTAIFSPATAMSLALEMFQEALHLLSHEGQEGGVVTEADPGPITEDQFTMTGYPPPLQQ